MFKNISLKLALFAAVLGMGSEAQAISKGAVKAIVTSASAVVGGAGSLAATLALVKKVEKIRVLLDVSSEDYSFADCGAWKPATTLVAGTLLGATVCGLTGFFVTRAVQNRAKKNAEAVQPVVEAVQAEVAAA